MSESKQDRKFCARVLENLPEMTADVKQGWIENPRGLAKVLREGLCPSKWYEKDKVIHFSATSNGLAAKEWIVHFEKKGYPLSDDAKRVLLSPQFVPTRGVTTQGVVLKGELFTDNNRITRKIRATAAERTLTAPSIEFGCLVRDMFTNDEIRALGLKWLVTFHEPVIIGGSPRVLATTSFGGGERLATGWASPGYEWDRDRGFVFAVPQEPLEPQTL